MVITTIAIIILDIDCDNVKNYDNCNHNHTRKKNYCADDYNNNCYNDNNNNNTDKQ